MGRILEKAIDKSKLYRKHVYKIPVLRPYLLYHGTEEQPLEQIVRLSSAYVDFGRCNEHPIVEFEVKLINLSSSLAHPILERSQTLKEYVLFIECVRDKMYRLKIDRDTAIKAAIKECIEKGILAEFLKEHGSEVNNMLFDEVTYDDLLQIRLEENTEEVTNKGIGILVGTCRELGLSETETQKKLEEKYQLSILEAKEQLKEHWN